MSSVPSELSPENTPVTSYYAPPERASPESVQRMATSVLETPLFTRLLEAMPCPAVVLNQERQIVYANGRMLAVVNGGQQAEVLGKRPGEVVGCIHAKEGPAGCGTSEACAMCGAVNAILECQRTGRMITQECRISVETGYEGALDFEVVACSFSLSSEPVTVCSLRDISHEKRRQILERVFFHDILNTAGGIYGLIQLLAEDNDKPSNAEERNLKILSTLSERLVHELREHRQLLMAERGELRTYPGVVSPEDILYEIQALLSNHDAAHGRNILIEKMPNSVLETDPDLLRRVLVNMAKNALEATPTAGTVTLSCETTGDKVVFHVHNTTSMPKEVQLQIFNRSFSTKAGQGHGVGTYSMKLFGERYLGGKVYFTSGESQGTTFTLEVAKEWRERS